jgi:N-acetylated-alpha-linked acidic dipeptidase
VLTFILVWGALATPAQAAPPDPAAVSAERLGATLATLCERPRFAGSDDARAAADFAASVFSSAGLRVDRPRYSCLLPRQTAQSLELLGADGRWEELSLLEVPLAEDAFTRQAQVPPMLGLCAPGSAEGAVYYAGYGTRGEFDKLREEHGAALDGAIALCRYGNLFRGLKLAHAEAAGFGGVLLYPDELDDGSAQGAMMPDGPWRPRDGIQRGSVFNGKGDPLTPGWPALPAARRLARDEAPGIVHVPGLPISMDAAARLMAGAERKLGPLTTRVRMKVEQDESLRPVENVIGWIEGATRPDEWVLVGAHRDSWGPGAVDNGSGSAVLLEMARVLGEAVARGWRPQRTLVLATWDAEEWGLVGSTEWVEQQAHLLRERAVAYVNMDVVASGPSFGASCTPGLVETLRAACAAEGLEVPANLGVPGGGSDHVPFLELAGVEVMGFGFSGGSGTYHSLHDTPWVVNSFLDPGFQNHARAARMGLRLATLLAEDQVPVDGLRGWLRQAARAAEALSADTDAERIARLELMTAALKAALAAEESADLSNGPQWRFGRLFLPAQESGEVLAPSRLWRSAGYGSEWFLDRADGWLASRTALLELAQSLRGS